MGEHQRENGDERLVVVLGGELDVDRAPMLAEALEMAIDQPGGPVEIVLDVAGLEFCDSSGLNVLLRAHSNAQGHGKRLSLRAPRPQLRRLLALTGSERLFPITDT
ncbi:STAS domain-containing protein [Streptomyces sp. NPDC101132]|uniref:STAS domain-containing protein n=1 Tax=Streptomyces sp. NPDC101132 TaxID=3366110 RepID=UPI00380DCA9B